MSTRVRLWFVFDGSKEKQDFGEYPSERSAWGALHILQITVHNGVWIIEEIRDDEEDHDESKGV